jgi:hypothetical protein
MSEEVKDCPFCAAKSVLRHTELIPDGWWEHGESADPHCPSRAWRAWTSEVERIAAWNRRADPAPQPATSTVEVEPVNIKAMLRSAFEEGRISTHGTDRHYGERAWANSEASRVDVALVPASALYAALEDKKRAVDRVTELETAARHIWPYLVYTISDESPGHHPTMTSAVGAFTEAVGIDALKKKPPRAALTKERSE